MQTVEAVLLALTGCPTFTARDMQSTHGHLGCYGDFALLTAWLRQRRLSFQVILTFLLRDRLLETVIPGR